MEDMTSSTQLKPIFKRKTDKPSCQTLFLFVTSIARTNLEVELVQRGGNLVAVSSEPPNPLLPKRDCIGLINSNHLCFRKLNYFFLVPLLHVLAVHARVLALWPAGVTFQQLCGLPAYTNVEGALTAREEEVPLLLRDPIALLLQFVLLLPLHLDQSRYCEFHLKLLY